MRTALVWTLLVGGAAGVAQAEPVTYRLDSDSSRLTVRVFKEDSALSDLAHDHVILATGWAGSATLDVAEDGVVSSCEVKVVVPVARLAADPPEQRKKEGMEVMLTESQQAQVKEHMLAKGQLDEKNHRQIRFAAHRCSGTLADLQVDGQLTLQGRSVPVRLSLEASIADGSLHATGGFQVTHKDLGLTPYSAFLGTLKNQQKLVFGVDVVGKAE
jgi:hypothetical protein